MLIKTFIIIAIYLAILLGFIQLAFTTVEKAKAELALFAVEFNNEQKCAQNAVLRSVGGNAIYSTLSDCNG